MARIAIVGAGAIGGVVASLLQATGRHELVLCVRRSIRQLIVETSYGEVRIDATVLTQPEEAKPVDWVIGLPRPMMLLPRRCGSIRSAPRALPWRCCRTAWNTGSDSPLI